MSEPLCIDVSYHNGNIDWEKVKASGINNAIIRAGYGKSTVDKRFTYNITNAIKNGVTVGVYWFIYASSEADVVTNAQMFVKTISPYASFIKLKCWADWEYDSDKNCKVALSKTVRTNWVKKFCEVVKASGYTPGIYANPDYIKNKFTSITDYPLWLAQYGTKKSYSCEMWQYTSKGTCPGISGNVDISKTYTEAVTTTPAQTTTTTSNYYPKYTGTSGSITQALAAVGEKDTSYAHRTKIAKANNITGYTGTSAQNTKMVTLLKSGKLIKA